MKVGKFISNYLKAKDLRTPQTYTITAAEEAEFKNEKPGDKPKLVIYFKEIEQGVVTCPESINQIVEILGSEETDEWIGKKIVVFCDAAVKFQNKPIGGIRFRAVTEKGAKA